MEENVKLKRGVFKIRCVYADRAYAEADGWFYSFGEYVKDIGFVDMFCKFTDGDVYSPSWAAVIEEE